MACPTCDHTMENLSGGETPWFWCPRCGTVKRGVTVVPKLVKRVVELLGSGVIPPEAMEKAERLGVVESVSKPKER